MTTRIIWGTHGKKKLESKLFESENDYFNDFLADRLSDNKVFQIAITRMDSSVQRDVPK